MFRLESRIGDSNLLVHHIKHDIEIGIIQPIPRRKMAEAVDGSPVPKSVDGRRLTPWTSIHIGTERCAFYFRWGQPR
jgi:hypothetical protein